MASTSRIIGWVLVGLVSFVLVAAGAGKVFGFAPDEVIETLTKSKLGDKLHLIGAGAMITGVLLFVPRTSSLGVLLASSYWGGAIIVHMTLHESFAPPAMLLLLTWVGSALRDPRVMGSFCGPCPEPPPVDSPSEAPSEPAASPESGLRSETHQR